MNDIVGGQSSGPTGRQVAQQHELLLVGDVARKLRHEFDRRAKEVGLTRAQWQIVHALSRRDGITQSALADYLQIEAMTLSRTLDRLVRDGWVERRANEKDRRSRHLHLTPAAEPSLEKMAVLADKIFETVFKDFAESEIRSVVSLLRRMLKNLTG